MSTQMPAGRYVLIDFEHSGFAGDVPPFEPLYHWPPECREPNAPYTSAADIHSVGALMKVYPAVEGDSMASSLCQQLMADDAAQRPSASEALKHPWLIS